VIDGTVAVGGAVVTVKVAGPLVTVPCAFVTLTVKTEPLSPLTVAGVVYVLEVAPVMATLPSYHWYVKGAEPEAVTLKVAVCPTCTVWFAGWVTISGASGGTVLEMAATVKVAGVLVTEPAALLTVTVNTSPLLVLVVAGVV
jgi:hypothetical protein